MKLFPLILLLFLASPVLSQAKPAPRDIVGDDGNNTLTGRKKVDNVIDGRGGDDTLIGRGGKDTLRGGAGRDTINGASGPDKIYGGDGDDTIDGAQGRDKIFGGNGNDHILCGNARDFVSGGEGDDFINGQIAGDYIFGNEGNDTMYGEDGVDLMVGGSGDDVLYGGSYDDFFWGDASPDPSKGLTADGNVGRDTFVFLPGDGIDTIFDFTIGTDKLVFERFLKDEKVSVASATVANVDGLTGVATDTTTPGAELAIGNVRVFLAGVTVAEVNANIASMAEYRVWKVPDATIGLKGDDNANKLVGTDADEVILGKGGDDTIVGGGGSDMIVGNQGDDILRGGTAETHRAGANTFVFRPGDGTDTLLDFHAKTDFLVFDGFGLGTQFSYRFATTGVLQPDGSTKDQAGVIMQYGDVTIQLPGMTDQPFAKNDFLQNHVEFVNLHRPSAQDSDPGYLATLGEDAERGHIGPEPGKVKQVNGDAGDNIMVGTNGHDRLWGHGGDDVLRGLDGNDKLIGNHGNDTIYGGNGNEMMEGYPGDDVLYGEAGDDAIYGNYGNDTIYGGAGNDLIGGGAENDIICGGTGNDRIYGDHRDGQFKLGDDTFVFQAGDGHDMIFDWGRGDDKIVFKGLGDRSDMTLHQVGRDTIVQIGDVMVKLNEVDKSTLKTDDFELLSTTIPPKNQ